MTKNIITIILLILIISCSDNNRLEELEITLNQQQGMISELKKEIKEKNRDLTNSESKIKTLNEKIEILENREVLKQIGEPYDFYSYLVDNGISILPSGFIKTTGYIAHKNIPVKDEVEINGEIHTFEEIIYEGYMFFSTEQSSPLNHYLKETIGNSYFIEDEDGYIGFPVQVDNVRDFTPTHKELEYLLTIHRTPEYAPVSTMGASFATVYGVKD